MVKILVTGSAGFLGKNIFNQLKDKHQVYGISRRTSQTTTHPMDITNLDMEQLLNKLNPDIIVHTAALTGVDYCESHKEEAWKINVLGTENLVTWCKNNNKKIIYISTDYVYPGILNNYDETSEVNPVSVYGITKLEAERKVQTLKNWTILRPTVIFGYDFGGNNFLMQMLALKEKRKIPFDQIRNPTDVKVLCKQIDKIIDSKIEGLFIATGPETIDRYKFALLIAKIFNLDKNLLESTSTAEFNQIAKRPLNNGTNSSKIRSILNYKCPTLHQSLEAIKNQIWTTA